MAHDGTTILIKIPARILACLPATKIGRSRFIIRALENEIERRRASKWKPTTRRGWKFAKLLEAGKAERGPWMSEAELERELKERRGRNFENFH